MSWLANTSKLTRYDDTDFFYIRKPHDIPSVRGFRLSMFEILEEYIQTHDDEFTRLLCQNQGEFGLESEWWLCNRLDIPTAGLLYFAKSQKVFDQYRAAQVDNTLVKYYTGTIVGRLDETRIIARDIAHHPHLEDRMVVANKHEIVAYSGTWQHWWTQLKPLEYNKEKNQTSVLIMISGGVRHQIRIHCASIGSPLVGETLYGTKNNRQVADYLQLFCVGHQTTNP